MRRRAPQCRRGDEGRDVTAGRPASPALGADAARRLVDGRTVAQQQAFDTAFGTGLGLVRAGLITGGGSAPIQIWMDEVLGARAPIGCP